jgi:hypothetical protein
MDLEDIENQLENERIIQQAGYLDSQHFYECQYNMAEGLKRFGDAFLRSLGETLQLALQNDALKIMRYWNQACETHATLYKMYVAKHEAENPPLSDNA